MDTLEDRRPPLTGQLAPDFSLPDLDGKLHRLAGYQGSILVLNFWSAECPHAGRTDREMQRLQAGWGENVVVLNVASNANEPLELLRTAASVRGLAPVLVDQNHVVADRYAAVTTPHVYVIDAQGALRYQGAFDDVTFRRRTPTRAYLQEAVQALLAEQEPPIEQTPAYGCSIVRHALLG
jgi:peroxiredoxin